MVTVTNKATPPRKTKPKGRHPDKALSAAFVRTAPPGRHADGNGLYLFVQPSGTRSWIQRLLIRGRRRELGLGSVALVSLAEAREKALANRKLAREGGDPLAEKRRRQGVPSFAEATARVVEQKQAGWRNRAHGREWILTFERYAFPRIGKMPVSEWAVAMEFWIDNPCDRIDPVLGPQRDVVQHMRALPHREVAAAIQTARASTVPSAVRLAFEFLVLTAARWGAVRWAEWTEIDRDEGVWTVPARRTKPNREHRVPLCGRALEILDGARTLVKGTSPYLFPNRLGKQLEEKQLRRMLGKHKIAAVPHGFRSSFRDWAAEETDHPREVIEAALAHVVQNRVEAAYRRTDLFERRRRLMNDWAAYLSGDSGEKPGQIVSESSLGDPTG